MDYSLLKETIGLLEDFEGAAHEQGSYPKTLVGLKRWIVDQKSLSTEEDPIAEWDGKGTGRTADSAISTLLVHMNKYAKNYSKAAIYGSDFSTQEEFIFLIVLRAFGPMTKMDLIKRNVQEKPAGIKVIDRLLKQGWVCQIDSDQDKRSKVVSLTPKGVEILDAHMDKIRMATRIVPGKLTELEKNQLIALLTKLEDFHKPIYLKNIPPSDLLDTVADEYL
ncbi:MULTISPECIES: MarR family winged helix-turn-helix transcriptional regulator [Sphingobacterium]|uniref:MarR family winged helix-turn-helix transcriptional regulator n=1 Tax=Sphingobacterium TaxID=28453 RepID=UPI0013DA016B|nr:MULTISPECIES: winged helix DNA-binding protein [unclassified Sphingobacterium]